VLRASDYAATETLRDGRAVKIRALKPDDRDGLLAAVGRSSDASLYRRFFSFKRGFTEREIDFFVNVDFVSHVALVAVLRNNGEEAIVGGARYIVVQPGKAEMAFAVDDAHQKKGVGAALMRHLTTLARQGGVKELVADVLPDNAAMLKVFESSGFPMDKELEGTAIHLSLHLR
jgi:RimJ/RimL family protein N-acetyltransferase